MGVPPNIIDSKHSGASKRCNYRKVLSTDTSRFTRTKGNVLPFYIPSHHSGYVYLELSLRELVTKMKSGKVMTYGRKGVCPDAGKMPAQPSGALLSQLRGTMWRPYKGMAQRRNPGHLSIASTPYLLQSLKLLVKESPFCSPH
jgi:hypothetical protein